MEITKFSFVFFWVLLTSQIAHAQKVALARNVLHTPVNFQVHFNNRTDTFDLNKPVYILCSMGVATEKTNIKKILPFDKKNYEKDGGDGCIGPHPFPNKTLILKQFNAKCPDNAVRYAVQFDDELDTLLRYTVKSYSSKHLNHLLIKSLEKHHKDKLFTDDAFKDGFYGTKWVAKCKDGTTFAIYFLQMIFQKDEHFSNYVVIEVDNNFLFRTFL